MSEEIDVRTALAEDAGSDAAMGTRDHGVGGLLLSRAHVRPSAAGLIGGLIVAVAVIVAVLAPVIAPYNPNAQNLAAHFMPPVFAGGKMSHLLGTDDLGRDLLSEIIYGTRVSLLVPGLALAIAVPVGTLFGILGGYFGGVTDMVAMRLVDVVLAFPSLVLAIAALTVLPPSIWTVSMVLGIGGWATLARVVRGRVLSVRELAYVEASQVLGANKKRVLARHILPNVLPTVVVISSLQFSVFILAQAALSYLGLGTPANVPSWGSIMEDGQNYLGNAWWIETLPGIAVVLLVAGVGLLGDWLNYVMERKAT